MGGMPLRRRPARQGEFLLIWAALIRLVLSGQESIPANWLQKDDLLAILPEEKAQKIIDLRLASGMWQADSECPRDASARWYYYPQKTGFRPNAVADPAPRVLNFESQGEEEGAGAATVEEERQTDDAEQGAREDGAGEGEEQGQRAQGPSAEETQDEGGEAEEAEEPEPIDAEEEEQEGARASAISAGGGGGASFAVAARRLLGIEDKRSRQQRGDWKWQVVVPEVRRPACVGHVARELSEKPPAPVGVQRPVPKPPGRPPKRGLAGNPAPAPAPADDLAPAPEPEQAAPPEGRRAKRQRPASPSMAAKLEAKAAKLEALLAGVAPRPPGRSGGTCYTLVSGKGSAKIQVLLKAKGSFYIAHTCEGVPMPSKRLISWSNFDSPADAWAKACELSGF